jgi:flagellar biosynthetic protein FlhB
MAQEDENGQERTEEPTPKRRREAREKGEIARSRELNTTLVMLAGVTGLYVFGGYMGEGLYTVIDTNFRFDRSVAFDTMAPVRMLHQAIGQGLLIVAPFALLMLLAALGGSTVLGGWSFSGKAMAPKLEKMNPIKGLQRMFGMRSLMELVKALAKVSVVGAVGGIFLYSFQDDFRLLADAPLESGIAEGVRLFFLAFLLLSAALALVAAVDVPYQLYETTKKLRMTKQEIKDEYKETEGKPEVKGRIRQLQRELARGRMLEKVPTADVVVTNPTHFAVALKYDQLKMRAPKVVAKGTDLVAARIRELAAENKVPIFEAPPLARALYHTTQLDREIPGGLYLAVAQVLAYIYQLRSMSGQRPQRPQPEIPPDFMKYVDKGVGAEQ